MNEKLIKFFKNSNTRLVLVILLALFLIMVSIVLFEDIQLDNTILILNIFGTITLISFLYSYSLTKKNIRNDLCVGMTRKSIYNNYLRTVLISLLISIFLVIYYMLVYKIVINVKETIFEIFDLKLLIFLPLVFLTLSFFGFFLGLCQMRRSLFYSIVTIILSAVILIILYFSIAYYYSAILLVLVISLGIINYLFVMNYDI